MRQRTREGENLGYANRLDVGRPQESPNCFGHRASERGVALLVALMLIVVLSLLAFALVTRSFVASRVAGIERYSAMTFYAADGGITGAKVRLPVGNTDGFTFDTQDLRGSVAGSAGRPIEVEVSSFLAAGPPRAAVGSQIGGGQGSDGESLCVLVYRGDSQAFHKPTGSRRRVSATLSVGPVPLSSALAQVPDLAQGGER